MTKIRLDHLVIAAASLTEGQDWVEELLGIPAQGGGRHVSMGTHNALWGMGECYLEVIAVDPEGARPDRPRWFGFDDGEVQARLATGPYLLTWAVSVDDLAAVRAPVACHPPEDFARDDLRWQVVLPQGAALPLGGAWPLTIRWTHGLHPARRLPDQGVVLERFEVSGAGVAKTQAALGPVEGPVVFTSNDDPVRLSAVIRTPGGVVKF
jgi:hypothetical protein